jgi:nitroreductase
MDLDKVVEKRHSVRSFKDKKVSWKDVMTAIDSALQGPFAGNMNNLKFIIVENTEKIKNIANHSQQSWISESGILIVVCSDDSFLEKQYGDRGTVYSKQQAGATINTLLLKLTDLGLGNCWVGAYADEYVKRELDIPSDIQVEAIIPVGYENPSKIRKKPSKHTLERAINWEKWGKNKRPAFFQDTNISHREVY